MRSPLCYIFCCITKINSHQIMPRDIPFIDIISTLYYLHQMGRVKRIWSLLPRRAAKVQASLRIRAVSPEPPLLAHTSSESRGTFRQKARSLASLNGWACAVKICHDGMLEDTNSLDGAQIKMWSIWPINIVLYLCQINKHHYLCDPFMKQLFCVTALSTRRPLVL